MSRHSVRLESPESRPLDLPEANVLAVSRSGEVALALGSHLDGIVTYGTLARVPIAGGAPRQILEGVKFADWSPDGSELAIVRRVDGRDRLEFPIGKILVQPATGENTGLGFARVSPDGRRVAFVHYRSPGSLVGTVSIVDQTGTVTPLSTEYANIHGLAWKDEEIWYTAADDRPLFRALCAVTQGGTRRTITRTPGNATLWDVSSEGRSCLPILPTGRSWSRSFPVRPTNAICPGSMPQRPRTFRRMEGCCSLRSRDRVPARSSRPTFGEPTVPPPCAWDRAGP